MRAYILSAILALTHFTSFSFTAPLTSANLSPLDTRTHDSPSTSNPVAETHLTPLSPSLSPRASTPVWWVDPTPGSRVKILMTFLSRIPGPFILKLISTSYMAVQNHISSAGDGLLPQGVFEAEYHDLNLWTRNANNHQQTFGVLKGALNALNHYMFTEQIGSATFLIFDGATAVAVGAIGPHEVMGEETAREAATAAAAAAVAAAAAMGSGS